MFANHTDSNNGESFKEALDSVEHIIFSNANSMLEFIVKTYSLLHEILISGPFYFFAVL